MTTINEYKKIELRLDGKKSISVPINITTNGRTISDPVDVILRGFLKFEETNEQQISSNDLEDKTVVYPVLFSTDTIRVNNGRCVFVLLPRSEDLFETTAQVQESAEESISDSDIVSNGGVLPDEQITDPDKEPVIIEINYGETRTPYKISIEVTVSSIDDTTINTKTVDRGTEPKIEAATASKFLFQKETKRVPSNLVIDCSSDLEWIPSVNSVLGDNNSSRDTILSEVQNLKNSTPLGTSTMYDAVVAGARILFNTSDDSDRKTIYLFTDNESNISIASLDNAVDEVNDIDGPQKTPILSGNMAISDKVTLSIKANRSDTKNINKLSFLTGGQSVTIVDEDFLNDIVGIFYREAVGSMGYGTYEFVNDFGEEVLINRISATFDIATSDSNATWSIETSLDGYNYTAIDTTYNSIDSVLFENLLVRYIRFKIVLITGISSAFLDEYGTVPDTPALEYIEIIYNANKVKYLYLNKEESDVQPFHIALAVDANEINDDQIEVGVAKSNSHNWNDYSTESQPIVKQNGKVVIPLRFSQDVSEFQQEPLKKVDQFVTRAEYGRWDYFASAIVYDKSNNVIPNNFYDLYPREGRVVFNTALPSDYQDGDYTIGIINTGDYKVGLKLTNKTEKETLDIFGIGYEFSTGRDLLPPISKAAPEIQQISIVNDSPGRFSIIEATYTYYDSNFEPEDTSKRVINWFINGTPIDYLDGYIKWNDITNPQDPLYTNTSLSYPTSTELAGQSIEAWAKSQTVSILSPDDVVYCEIRVSDGDLFSDKASSAPVTVLESIPVLLPITIMAYDQDGRVTTRLATDTKAIIQPPIEEAFFTDGGGDNLSEVIWIVNDEIFKRGIFGMPVEDGQPPIHEIWINEIGTGNFIDYALRISNSISVQVIPQTDSSIGATVTAPTVVVQNGLPRVSDLEFVSSAHPDNQDIVAIWIFKDFEIQQIQDIDETGQFDQTGVKWYRKNPGESDFTLVYSYNDIDDNLREIFFEEVYRDNISTRLAIDGTSSTVSKNILIENQQWYVSVTPNDTIDTGAPIQSEIVTITASTN